MARGRKSSLVVLLTSTKRSDLEALQRRTTISAGRARRARMVLLRADGASLADVARRVEVVSQPPFPRPSPQVTSEALP